MPTVPPKYSFSLSEFGEVPADKVSQVAEDVADFLKEEILEHVGEGNSPVAGHGKFKKLNPNNTPGGQAYVDNEKGGSNKPNLNNEGAMLDGLRVENDGRTIKVFMDDDQNDKASGHNQHGAGKHPHLDIRRFIPESDEGFKSKITEGIARIVKKSETTARDASNILAEAFRGTAVQTQVTDSLAQATRTRNLSDSQVSEAERLSRSILASFFGSGAGNG